MDRHKLTLEELLKTTNFKEAHIVAGQTSLNRFVRWIHILEITEIRELVNGNEVILSTGVGWSNSEEEACSFLFQLIERNVAGLCVELGRYLPSLPKEMIQLANKYDFPLIIFPKKVKFIEITHNINTMLMETQYKMMSDLESYSNKLNHLLLSSKPFRAILKALHSSLNLQVVYKTLQGHLISVPELEDQKLIQLLSQNEQATIEACHTVEERIMTHPIQGLGHKFADLFIIGKNRSFTEFDSLVLDRTAIALAQDQLRKLYVEQNRLVRENQWVMNWLNGDYQENKIESFLNNHDPSIEKAQYVVCLCKVVQKQQNTDLTYFSMMFCDVFKQFGFSPLIAIDRQTIIFILFNLRKEDWQKRCRLAVDQIYKIIKLKGKNNHLFIFSVGKLCNVLANLKENYKKVQKILLLKEKKNLRSILFYEEFYLDRVFLNMDKSELQEYVNDYIGKLLDYDIRNKETLFETLNVLIDVNGSKKEASKRLHVVRQTLYYRKEKLKEILGEDFMDSERRLAIEFAVKAKLFLDATG